MTFRIEHLPQNERPREKLTRFGASQLTTVELIAVLLGTGTKKQSVLELSQAIVAHFGTAEKLSSATSAELCEISGIGPAKALILKAAFGLASKFRCGIDPARTTIQSPKQAYHYLRDRMSHQTREHVILLLLDAKSKLIAEETISIGTLTEAIIHPREVFYPAIRHKAVSLIIAHNHPGGDPSPSKSDLKVTDRLIKAGKLIGITLVDHLIIGKNGYISLRKQVFN